MKLSNLFFVAILSVASLSHAEPKRIIHRRLEDMDPNETGAPTFASAVTASPTPKRQKVSVLCCRILFALCCPYSFGLVGL